MPPRGESPHNARKRSTRAVARIKLAGLLLEHPGKPVKYYADRMGVSNQRISALRRHIFQEWREDRAASFDDHVAQQMKQLDDIYERAVAGYIASQGEQVTTKREQGTQGKKGNHATVSETRVTKAGSAGFLKVALGALKQKSDLLGLAAPTRVDVVMHIEEERRRLAPQLINAVRREFPEATPEQLRRIFLAAQGIPDDRRVEVVEAEAKQRQITGEKD